MRGCLIKSLIGFLILVFAGVGILYFLYQAAQKPPEFYEAALQINPEAQKLAGSEFESRVLQLQNDLLEQGTWEAIFSDKQINGWLASDMPKKFPKALPANVYEPRVEIKPGIVHLAFRFESKQFSGIVVCSGEAYCTDKSNQVAVRIDDVKAGVVSLPVSKWLDEIAKGITRSGFSVVWSEENGNPVALITIPEDTLEGGDVVVESIELLDGKVRLRGRTTAPGNNTGDDLPFVP